MCGFCNVWVCVCVRSLMCVCVCVYVCFLLWTAVAQCLRCCATNRKVAGSIPAGITGIIHFHSSDRTMALGSTQPLREMSNRSIS